MRGAHHGPRERIDQDVASGRPEPYRPQVVRAAVDEWGGDDHMRWLVLLVLLGIGMTGGDAGAQAPTTIEGGAVRVDALPAGAVLAIDGQLRGGPGDVAGQWIVLAPGPHAIDIALRGGGAIRVTVVVPAESSGYHVVPKP